MTTKFPIMCIFTPEDLEEFEASFNALDQDGDRRITYDELATALKQYHVDTNNRVLMDMFSRSDINDDGTIDYSEYLKMIKRMLIPDAEKDILENIFKVIDKNNDSFITPDELNLFMKDRGEELNETEIDEIFTKTDMNGDRKINCEEFFDIILANKL